MTAAVQQLLPNSTVLAIDSQDWNKDEFSLGTWRPYRPDQVMKYFHQLQEPHGRVHLANSNLASDRARSIDGAIESALQANETLNAFLGTAEVQHYTNALKVGTT